MSERESLFGDLRTLDSRGAIDMMRALNVAFAHAAKRGGTDLARFLDALHQEGWQLVPCEKSPRSETAEAEPTDTEPKED